MKVLNKIFEVFMESITEVQVTKMSSLTNQQSTVSIAIMPGNEVI